MWFPDVFLKVNTIFLYPRALIRSVLQNSEDTSGMFKFGCHFTLILYVHVSVNIHRVSFEGATVQLCACNAPPKGSPTKIYKFKFGFKQTPIRFLLKR